MNCSPIAWGTLAWLCLSGCTNQQVYDGLQAGKRSDCQRYPEPDRTRCLESTNTQYEDYEREREKARAK